MDNRGQRRLAGLPGFFRSRSAQVSAVTLLGAVGVMRRLRKTEERLNPAVGGAGEGRGCGGAPNIRSQVEEDLRRERDILATAQRIAHIGSWTWDPITREEQWSDETYRILGYEPRAFQPTEEVYENRVHPDDREAVIRTINEAWEAEKGFTVECRILLPDGAERVVRSDSEVVFDADSKPVRTIGTIQDITERKAAQEQLREREDQYRSVFQETSDGLVINTLEGVIVEANPAMCAMHGYSYEEFLRLQPTQFIHPDHHYLFSDFIETVKAGGQFRTRAVDIRKDGTQFHVEVRGTGFTQGGKPHILAVVRDISEEVKTYELLERRVAERTRELSALLEVSHNVASTLELRRLLGLTLDQLKSVVHYTGASIFTLEGENLTVLDYRGPLPADQVVGYTLPLESLEADKEAVRRRAPVIIHDVLEDSPFATAWRDTSGERMYTSFGYIRSWMGVPLMLKDRAIGMLTLDHSEPDYYTPRHAELAMAIANQAAIAIENARLYERAQQGAALEERQRLARELHDSVSQALYGIALGARTARTLIDRDPSQVTQPLDYVLSLAEAGLAEMRALIFELRPESLETEGLVAALDKQAASLRARHDIEVSFEVCDEPDMPLDLKEALYRIAQEALHNTVKHARAGRVDVRLHCEPERITLEICDDGVGFDPAGTFPGHLGLRSMRERAARLGGALNIESHPGNGAHLWAILPLKRGARQ